jgi:hypothetical protein
VHAVNQFDFVRGVVLIVPCSKGSRLSCRWIPGSLGEYGISHETTMANGEQIQQWLQTAAVPGLVLWAPVDLLIWPPQQACIEGADHVCNVRLGWLSNHFNAPFTPTALVEIAKFVTNVLARPDEVSVPLEGSCEQRRRRGIPPTIEGEPGPSTHHGRKRQFPPVATGMQAA